MLARAEFKAGLWGVGAGRLGCTRSVHRHAHGEDRGWQGCAAKQRTQAGSGPVGRHRGLVQEVMGAGSWAAVQELGGGFTWGLGWGVERAWVQKKLLPAGVPWTSPEGPLSLAFPLCEVGLLIASLPPKRAGSPVTPKEDVLFKPGPQSHRSRHRH